MLVLFLHGNELKCFYLQVNIENEIGTAGLYYLFAGFGLTSVIFVILFVPETKGRSPDQMREIFRRSKKIEMKEINAKEDQNIGRF